MNKKLLNLNTNELSEFCSIMIPNIWTGKLSKRLNPKRHIAFKNYVQKILKATQISFGCILLGLYYIQKLRLSYPSIKASNGSEVRLFTTSLVLANKFLDDNTFTNKTWSEVSNIPIHELNIMEMEFLSALNYNIFINHQEYQQWLNQCQISYNELQILNQNYYPTITTFKKKQTSFIDPITFIDYSPIYKPILSWSSSISTFNQDNNLNNMNNSTFNPYYY